MRRAWAWALAAAARWGACTDAALVLRADVAFKMDLPLPAPATAAAAAVLLPHPAPPCARLTATPNGHRRVGDTFFYLPADLYARLAYALRVKDALSIKPIALHDLGDFLPHRRLRFWLAGEYESNTAVAPNPLFFQTGRDGATEQSKPCAVRPVSVPWAPDGKAVWAAALESARVNAQEARGLLGSYEYTAHGAARLG